MSEKKGHSGTQALELDCHTHEAESPSIGSGPAGAVFRFSLKRINDETLAALTAAKANNATVRLRFDAEQFLHLTIIGLDRAEAMLRVEGRILEATRRRGDGGGDGAT